MMNGNGSIVLGRRENAVFILTPLYLVLFYFFREFVNADIQGLYLLMRVPYIIAFAVAVISIMRFFRRAFVPSVILEYDAMNLYINKGLKGTQMIPWSDVRAVENLQVHGSLSAFIDALRRCFRFQRRAGLIQAAWDLSTTGVIVINCKGELVRVHGIKNAREVRNQLHGIIVQKRKNLERGYTLR